MNHFAWPSFPFHHPPPPCPPPWRILEGNGGGQREARALGGCHRNIQSDGESRALSAERRISPAPVVLSSPSCLSPFGPRSRDESRTCGLCGVLNAASRTEESARYRQGSVHNCFARPPELARLYARCGIGPRSPRFHPSRPCRRSQSPGSSLHARGTECRRCPWRCSSMRRLQGRASCSKRRVERERERESGGMRRQKKTKESRTRDDDRVERKKKPTPAKVQSQPIWRPPRTIHRMTRRGSSRQRSCGALRISREVERGARSRNAIQFSLSRIPAPPFYGLAQSRLVQWATRAASRSGCRLCLAHREQKGRPCRASALPYFLRRRIVLLHGVSPTSALASTPCDTESIVLRSRAPCAYTARL